jgi:MraZ protein
MSALETKKIQYYSRYPHGVDEKRRVQIPAKWRPEEENTQLTVIVWPQHKAGTCLRVLPPEELNKLVSDIEAMPKGDPKKVALRRFIGSESIQLTLDKAGRIVLPDGPARAADIQNEALLVGCIEHFEIWNPTRYENAKAADVEVATEAFSLMD